MFSGFKWVVLVWMLFAPAVAAAKDAALLLVENQYRNLPRAYGAALVDPLKAALEARGFEVISAVDVSSYEAWQSVEDFRAAAEGAERVFVFLVGHITTTGREDYLLTRYASQPTDVSIGAAAVPIGPIVAIAGAHPGRAVVMLSSTGYSLEAPGLTPGFSGPVPQGVTLVSGRPAELRRAAEEVFLAPGVAMSEAAARVPGLDVRGFVPDALPFLPAAGLRNPPVTTNEVNKEVVFWQVVNELGTVDAYLAYLRTYPGGRFAAPARQAIAQIENDADRRALDAEQALGLSQEDRRNVQRNLVLLGYNPRGIDGIFGPGTRQAIRVWQRAQGFPESGYLDAEQLRVLNLAAEVKAAEIEAEAEARKAEEERRDADYWRETGRGSNEAGLRAYLERYPDGLYADLARDKLREIEVEKAAAARAEERAKWRSARETDTVAAYRDYLGSYPQGAFREEARARIAELESETANAQVIADAKEEESRVAGNVVARLLVENRLARAGFDPGNVDGDFNQATRRAIRRFQRSHDLVATGYVTQETMVLLLSQQ